MEEYVFVEVVGEPSSTSYVVERACVNKDADLVRGGGVHCVVLEKLPSREFLCPCPALTDPVDAAFSGSMGELDMRRTSIESSCNVGD